MGSRRSRPSGSLAAGGLIARLRQQQQQFQLEQLERLEQRAGTVGVLLPDTKSSIRWEDVDRPLLQKAFQKAGVKAIIENAQGDKSTQQQQAEQAITNGAKVLLLVNLDSGSGAAIEAKRQVPGRQGHRLRPPHAQGRLGLLRVVRQRARSASCRARASSTASARPPGQPIAELNGSPTDNNATLFAQGYNSVLDPLYKAGKLKKVGDQSVPGLGQPEGADDLRADAAEEQQQDRGRARGQRRPRQRRDLGAARRASSSRSRSPARTRRCRASRTSSPATSA